VIKTERSEILIWAKNSNSWKHARRRDMIEKALTGLVP